jgi:hypothetical protein
MMAARILILLHLLTACALPVLAVEMETRGAARGDGRFDSEANTVVIDGRVDFAVDIAYLTLGGAYRAYDFTEGGYNPRGIDPVYGLKHRYIEARSSGLTFRGGHYFSTFGRGLTLRSFEDIGLEHDTSLDGFIVEYQAGPLAFAGLGGRVAERVTAVQRLEYRVRGGRVGTWLGSRGSIAVSGVSRDTEREDEEIVLPDDLSRFADHVIGGEAELWLGAVTLAGEYARRSGAYYPELKQGDRGGHAVYLMGTATSAWSTLFAEYKDYESFEHALVNPPTCVREHVWVLMNRVTHEMDLGNERGFLVEATLMPGADMQITGGASEGRRQGGGLAHWEIFSQVDHGTSPWGVSSVAAAWSREYVLGRFTEYMTGVIDLAYDLGSSRHLDLELEVQRRDLQELPYVDRPLSGRGDHPISGGRDDLPGRARSRLMVLRRRSHDDTR